MSQHDEYVGHRVHIGQRALELRVPFGLKGERLYAPTEIERGLACGCYCPSCGSVLLARQGDKNTPHFAHHDSPECAGGYESAIHMMAKQVLADRKYITLPEYRRELSASMTTGEVLTEEACVPAKRLDFDKVLVEKTTDGLRPDIIGVTRDGTEVLIEVFVTHAVDEQKRARFADRVMIELDLSHLSAEDLQSEDAFALSVLNNEPRQWMTGTYPDHDYQKALQAARQRLEQRKQEYMERYHQQLANEQQRRIREAERQRYQAEQDKLRKAAEAKRNREARVQYETDIKQFAEQHQRRRIDPVGKPLPEGVARNIIERLGVSAFPLELAYVDRSDWIFNVHRSIWQFEVFDVFIHGKPGNTFSTYAVMEYVVRRFGIVAWASELTLLKQQTNDMAEKWSMDSSVRGALGFLTQAEKKMIPNPRAIIQQYLEHLAIKGFLKPAPGCFSVKVASFGQLEQFRTREEKARLAAREEMPRQFERAREAENKQRDAIVDRKKKRVAFLIERVNDLYRSGYRHLRQCSLCSYYQPPEEGAACQECGSDRLNEVDVDETYLTQVPHRLACYRLFP